MKTLTFKSNIKCGGCIATVTPFLNNNEEISKWTVDLTSPDKLLNVETEKLEAKDVIDLLKQAGYKAETL